MAGCHKHILFSFQLTCFDPRRGLMRPFDGYMHAILLKAFFYKKKNLHHHQLTICVEETTEQLKRTACPCIAV